MMFTTILSFFGVGNAAKVIFKNFAIAIAIIAACGLLYFGVKSFYAHTVKTASVIAEQKQTIDRLVNDNKNLSDELKLITTIQKLNDDTVTDNKKAIEEIAKKTDDIIEKKNKKISKLRKEVKVVDNVPEFDPMIEKQISEVVIDSMWQAYNGTEETS